MKMVDSEMEEFDIFIKNIYQITLPFSRQLLLLSRCHFSVVFRKNKTEILKKIMKILKMQNLKKTFMSFQVRWYIIFRLDFTGPKPIFDFQAVTLVMTHESWHSTLHDSNTIA